VFLSVIIQGSSSLAPFNRTIDESVGTVLNGGWSQYSALNTWSAPGGTYL
jgi:hypothetical protein